jgi:phosphoglycolate phosphatase-like HAD superfamily hydrolase
MQDERSQLFLEDYMPRVKPFPKVPELFQRILDDGKKIALATSAKDKELKQLKKIAGIEGLFDEETSSDDADESKPHPDIFEAALKQVGDPEAQDSISIGDTPWDAIAAGKIGLPTIGMLCGGWPEAKLRDAGCVAIYRDPADLLDNYETSPLK